MQESPVSRDVIRPLAARIYALVRACPAGHVTTYGWIAAAVGYPRAARMVGWMLNKIPGGLDVPAQRVINSKGELSGSKAFGQIGRMRRLLEDEGVTFTPDGRVDLARYGWNPTRDLAPDDLAHILAEAAGEPIEVSDDLMRLLWDDPASPFRVTR